MSRSRHFPPYFILFSLERGFGESEKVHCERGEHALGVIWDGLEKGWVWGVTDPDQWDPLQGRSWCWCPAMPCLQSSQGQGEAQNLITWEVSVLRRDRCRVLWNQILKQSQEAGENPSSLLSQKILCFILSLDFELLQGFRWRKLWGLD